MKYLLLVLVLVVGTVGAIYVVDNVTRPAPPMMAAPYTPSVPSSTMMAQATPPQQNITISVAPQQPMEPIMPLMVAPDPPVVVSGPWFPGKFLIQRMRERRAAREAAHMQMQMQMQQSCP